MKYVLAIDQSTQGTKSSVFDENGRKISGAFLPHRQIVTDSGYVEHDLNEILANTLSVAKTAIETAHIDKTLIATVGITNQRETVAAWEKFTGKPLCHAIVWQCARAKTQCERIKNKAEIIKQKTGLDLSPYFSAAKMAWLIENVSSIQAAANKNDLCLGTIDSFLLAHLTEERNFYTECSNASRTQLFNIHTRVWDNELCELFGVPQSALAKVLPSDSVFGHTTLGGYLEKSIPVCGVLGDSQAALYGQNCIKAGQIKATYGTGSSVMMQMKDKIVMVDGLATSIAWNIDGKTDYVLEGNINYTGAVISRMVEWGWIGSPEESEICANQADKSDECIFVPAFSGLGAPYFNESAKGMLTGITRTTGKNEMVKAGLESIAYQIADVIFLMQKKSHVTVTELKTDGGPTVNKYLMQFQSDITGMKIAVSALKELSAFGVAKLALRGNGQIHIDYTCYLPQMPQKIKEQKMAAYKSTIKQVLIKN